MNRLLDMIAGLGLARGVAVAAQPERVVILYHGEVAYELQRRPGTESDELLAAVRHRLGILARQEAGALRFRRAA